VTASQPGPQSSPAVGVWAGPLFPDRHRWPVKLSYGAVILAPFQPRDWEEWSLVRQRNQAWLAPWEATDPVPRERRSPRQLFSRQRRETKAGSLAPWVIRYGETSRTPLIGQCTISNITFGAARSGSIGYWIDQAYAGRGLMPAAVALATDYAMQVMGLHRIEICIRPENAASLRVVEKLGFRYEGSRPRYLHIAGDWRDHHCFALDASETAGGLLARLPPKPSRGLGAAADSAARQSQ
jgi:ribosomal-protein-alanine N-acetyltransferase